MPCHILSLNVVFILFQIGLKQPELRRNDSSSALQKYFSAPRNTVQSLGGCQALHNPALLLYISRIKKRKKTRKIPPSISGHDRRVLYIRLYMHI